MKKEIKTSWSSPEAIHNRVSRDSYFDKSKNFSTSSLLKGEELKEKLENQATEKQAKNQKFGIITKSKETFDLPLFPSKDSSVPARPKDGKRLFPSKDSSVPTSAKIKRFGILKNEITGKEVIVSRKTPIKERLETAEKMVSYCIKRVQYRKQGAVFLLSKDDENDAKGAGMHACVAFGFFDHGKTEGLFKAIMRGIRGRDCLDLGRKKGKLRLSNQIETLSDSQEIFAPFENTKNRLRHSQIKKIREIMEALRQSRTLDLSRKSASNFKIAREFLFLNLSLITGKFPRTATPNAYDKRSAIFSSYLKRGMQAMTEKPLLININEIEKALSERAFS